MKAYHKLLANGKGVTVRWGLKEAGGKDVGRRTEMSYKAESPGKTAQHVKAQGAGDTVNDAVVHRKFTFLSGETCFPCDIMMFPVKLPEGYRFPNVPAQAMEAHPLL